ncbi:hypothetical protein ACJX0J_034322, partial [Zea mays]
PLSKNNNTCYAVSVVLGVFGQRCFLMALFNPVPFALIFFDDILLLERDQWQIKIKKLTIWIINKNTKYKHRKNLAKGTAGKKSYRNTTTAHMEENEQIRVLHLLDNFGHNPFF